MAANNPAWLRYQHLLQQGVEQLNSVTDMSSVLTISRQLAAQRLAIADTQAADIDTTDLLQQIAALPEAAQPAELLLLFCQLYRWPAKVRQLLLVAGFCSALAKQLPQAAEHAKLQPYPALLAAKLLHKLPQAAAVTTLLNNCYPTERNIAPWQQNPLSLLLTQCEYLCRDTESTQPIRQRIGLRIALSKSEYELQLLQRLLQPPRPGIELSDNNDLLSQSQFTRLCDADTKQLVLYLGQSAMLAAPVLALATELNRQQQPVTDLRLALNLIGRQQLPYMLAEAELLANLQQLQQPAQALLHQFSFCMAQALRLLPTLQLSLPQSRTLALCLCSELWRNETAYTSGLLKRTTQGWHSAIDNRCYTQDDACAGRLTALLQHYRLQQWIKPAQHWLQSLRGNAVPGDNNTLALLLAWHSSLVLFTPHSTQTLQRMFSLAQRPLLLPADSDTWLQQLLAGSNCYYPLELTL
ncbi:hypothetical protein [Rheinheimera sp. NSM]|uniref:hypothetical protein n=1 Tax=Rheinheimera sp. NSM TaxID=3457884 RepID=UPI004035F945